MSLPRMSPHVPADGLLRDSSGGIDGPVSIYGYDGKIYLDRATPAQWRAHRLRRAREKGTHTEREWFELRDRAGRCLICNSTTVTLTKDHIIPLIRGGCDCIQNIQPLCLRCNARKGVL